MNTLPATNYDDRRDSASDGAPLAVFAVAVAVSLAIHAGFGWAVRDARVSLFGTSLPGATAAQRLRLREDSALRTRLVPPPPPSPAESADPADRASASAP
ncbi:MAG: hypothetical protein IJL06_06785, partial [Kiritimatiellae bacterium]|nr:hypothetical protein [Kiritimatiellia bacterium]